MILKKLKIITSASLLFIGSNQTLAVDSLPGVELWLPKSYQAHFLKLVEAAKKIQREPECWQLLNGRLSERKSTQDAPVFYFRCRDGERKSFSYEVNMNTMEIFNLHLERQRLIEENKAKKQAEAVIALQKKAKPYWKLCHKAIKQKISSFNQAKIISELPPEGHSLGDGVMQFKVDVDGLSLSKKVLRYSARCNTSGPEAVDVKIKRRKK